MSFANLKKQSKLGSLTQKLVKEVEKMKADAEKYADGEQEVVAISELINQVAYTRNQYLGITKGFEIKHFQLTNIIKLRVAGMEDAEINNRH